MVHLSDALGLSVPYKYIPGTGLRPLGVEGLYQPSAQSIPLWELRNAPWQKCEMGDVWILWALSHLLLPDALAEHPRDTTLIQQPGYFTKWYVKVCVYIHIKRILYLCEYHLFQNLRSEFVSPFFSRFRRYQCLLLERSHPGLSCWMPLSV